MNCVTKYTLSVLCKLVQTLSFQDSPEFKSILMISHAEPHDSLLNSVDLLNRHSVRRLHAHTHHNFEKNGRPSYMSVFSFIQSLIFCRVVFSWLNIFASFFIFSSFLSMYFNPSNCSWFSFSFRLSSRGMFSHITGLNLK